MNTNELTYWVTLATMPKIWTKRKNELYVKCFQHQPQYTIIDLFERPEIWDELGMNDAEMSIFEEARNQLVNNSFMVEDLLSQGYEIIPMTSPDYPAALKKNLKQGTPTVLYIKGNKELLHSPSVAIVGSRKADSLSLTFTDNVAHKAVSESKVVVSGFAKGIDREALDAALASDGFSIIVLPQGITTFSSGFKQYYKPIVQGRVLVLSTFHPKAPWSVDLAMARNTIIYGIAEEIYAAQSDSKGGTWSGVMDGLKRGRKIYVRIPEANESNANQRLIDNGAIGVDKHGLIINQEDQKPTTDTLLVSDVSTDYDKTHQNLKESLVQDRVIEYLRKGHYTVKELINLCQFDWSDTKMRRFLEQLPEIRKSKKGRSNAYSLVKEENSLPGLI